MPGMTQRRATKTQDLGIWLPETIWNSLEHFFASRPFSSPVWTVRNWWEPLPAEYLAYVFIPWDTNALPFLPLPFGQFKYELECTLPNWACGLKKLAYSDLAAAPSRLHPGSIPFHTEPPQRSHFCVGVEGVGHVHPLWNIMQLTVKPFLIVWGPGLSRWLHQGSGCVTGWGHTDPRELLAVFSSAPPTWLLLL